MSAKRLCIFGEVLFDHFPDGERVLGGAPFNVAWHLQAFGQAPHFISRVGKDSEGDEIRAAMEAWGMERTGLQNDPVRPTGKVKVRFEGGEPSYDIVENCAYDAIAAETISSSATGLACSLLYHGSLALRSDTSRRALQRFRATKPKTVFVDVNLRSPWWRRELVLEMLQGAHWVKLNGGELRLLARYVTDGELGPSEFLNEFNLRGLVVTHGAGGAELHTSGGVFLRVRPTDNTDPVDTVGAGDAFASVMILGLARDWPLELTLQRAQAFASKIVTQRGATVSAPEFYRPFIDDWELEN